MLLLTRGVGERIVIGEGKDRVTIEVLEIHNSRIRLGIVAPGDVHILREELSRRLADGEVKEER